MKEEVKRVKKQIEVDVVELSVELSAEFFDNLDKAKKQVADKRGYDVSYGEYVEEAMNDLVKMVEDYSYKLQQATELIKKQDAMLGEPPAYVTDVPSEEPRDPETGEVEADVPDELYAHIEEDSAKEIMYV